MLAQLRSGLLEVLALATVAINAEQFQPVVDGLARVGFDVLEEGFCSALLKSHGQHDLGQLQRGLDMQFLPSLGHPGAGLDAWHRHSGICLRHFLRTGVLQ